VSVRLVASAQTAGIGSDKGKPVDVRSEELDVDDAQKTAHFRGKVVALQGDTMLQAPYLMVKYEGKAAAALDSKPKAPDGKADKEGARVTFLWVRNGAEITAGNDRRITCELVDFDVAADTALFQGKVIAVQDKNVLKGERLLVDRKGGTSRLEPEDGGRIFATFHQPASAKEQRKKDRPAAEIFGAIAGSFKNDPDAPMEIEADTLDVNDAAKKAIFNGKVRAHQGDMVLRASELTAFFSGKTGFGLPADDAGVNAKSEAKGQIVRLLAKGKVFLTSKDGQTAAADSAIFDVKANTALLVGSVFITKPTNDPKHPEKVHSIDAPRLKIDLTTGIYWAESDPSPPKAGPPKEPPPSDASNDPSKVPTCSPGRTCGTFFPPTKDKALDSLKKKKAPALDAN
jgi:lipopolysaccharide transport protein LptA